MNPLPIARNLREQYLTLLTTAFAPRQEDLAEAFRAEIDKDGFLTREPFIALAQLLQPSPIARRFLEEIAMSPKLCRGRILAADDGTGQATQASYVGKLL